MRGNSRNGIVVGSAYNRLVLSEIAYDVRMRLAEVYDLYVEAKPEQRDMLIGRISGLEDALKIIREYGAE